MMSHRGPLGRSLPLLFSVAFACSGDRSAPSDAGIDPRDAERDAAWDAPTDAGTDAGDAPITADIALAFEATPTYETASPILSRPTFVRGHLYLQSDETGTVVGIVSGTDGPRATVTAVTGTRSGDRVDLDAGSLTLPMRRSFAFRAFAITLTDRDGDGTPDGGTGELSGHFRQSSGDVIDETAYTGRAVFAVDTSDASASLVIPPTRRAGQVLPIDPLTLEFAEPISEAHLERLVLEADGVGVALRITRAPIAGFVTSAELYGVALWPFGAELALDATSMTDPSGNAVIADGSRVTVVSDPGMLLANPSFEDGLTGWLTAGSVETRSVYETLTPAHGSAQAIVLSESSLASVIDVPATGGELSFSIAVLSEIGEVDPDRTTVVALHRPSGERVVVFDVHAVREMSRDCPACAGFGHLLGPLQQRFDLAPYAGERLFLTLDVRSSFFIGVNYFAAVVDDFRLEDR